MHFFDSDRWTEIWVTITRNKTRSFMTCFGVFWGILMLVILLSAGVGLKNAIFHQVEGFASNSVFFYADRTSEAYKGFNKGRQWNMRNRDMELIREHVPEIEAISPVLWGSRSEKNVSHGNLSGSYTVQGLHSDYFKIISMKIYYGRLFNENDLREKRKVCVIGTDVNKNLFHNADPCGQYIRVNGLYYQVIGVIDQIAEGVNIGGRTKESVYIPFTTLQQTLNQGDILHFLS